MTEEQKFTRIMETVLSDEGGLRDRRSDPGGLTKWGVSQKAYPTLDIRALTREQATAIYKRDWWDKYGYGRIGNYTLCLKVFGHALNIGWTDKPVIASRAHLYLQEAANEVIAAGFGAHLQFLGPAGRPILLKVDGVLGPHTLETVNALDPVQVTLRFLARVHAHYKRCAKAQPAELPGWENRLWSCL